MIKLSILLCVVFITSLFADKNQIQVSGVVQANLNMQTKMTHIDNSTIQGNMYLQTNHHGFTISLSTPLSSVWLNNNSIGSRPLDFSDNIHAKSTKVGKLVISKNKYLNTLALTISIK